jgi:transcriptional regulator with XRE-family HTH domain
MNNKKLAIAKRLAVARQNAGLSQMQVSKKIGLHRPAITEIEAGRRRVGAEELTQFAKIYGVSISWLACEDAEHIDELKDKFKLAARDLSKINENDLQKVINLLQTLKGRD